MKLLVDFILLAAALGSVFYVAGLSNVPKRVRYSVLAIGPSFMLTFLLHLRWVQHLDYGLAAIGFSVLLAAVTGFHFTRTAPLTKEERSNLTKRFAIICAVSAVTVAFAAALIVRSGEQLIPKSTAPTTATPSSGTVAPSQSTSDAIDTFNRLKDGN